MKYFHFSRWIKLTKKKLTIFFYFLTPHLSPADLSLVLTMKRNFWEAFPWRTSRFMSNDCLKLQETLFSRAILTTGSVGNLVKKFFQSSECSLLGRKSNPQFLKIWFFDHFWQILTTVLLKMLKNREIRPLGILIVVF